MAEMFQNDQAALGEGRTVLIVLEEVEATWVNPPELRPAPGSCAARHSANALISPAWNS